MLLFCLSCLVITASGLSQMKLNDYSTQINNNQSSNSNFLPKIIDLDYDDHDYNLRNDTEIVRADDTRTVLLKGAKSGRNSDRKSGGNSGSSSGGNSGGNSGSNSGDSKVKKKQVKEKQKTVITKNTVITNNNIYNNNAGRYSSGHYSNYNSMSDGFLSGVFVGSTLSQLRNNMYYNNMYYGNGLFYYNNPLTHGVYASPYPYPPTGYSSFSGNANCYPTNIETVNCAKSSFSNSSIVQTFFEGSLKTFLNNGCVTVNSTIADFFGSDNCEKLMQAYGTMKITLGDLISSNLTTLNSTLGTLSNDVINKVSSLTSSLRSANNYTFESCTTSNVERKATASWATCHQTSIGLSAVFAVVLCGLSALGCWLCCACCKERTYTKTYTTDNESNNFCGSENSVYNATTTITTKTTKTTKSRNYEEKSSSSGSDIDSYQEKKPLQNTNNVDNQPAYQLTNHQSQHPQAPLYQPPYPQAPLYQPTYPQAPLYQPPYQAQYPQNNLYNTNPPQQGAFPSAPLPLQLRQL